MSPLSGLLGTVAYGEVEWYRLPVGKNTTTSEFAVGPYAAVGELQWLKRTSPARARLTIGEEVDGCGSLFSRAAAVLEMAGYNSTFEALAAGHRPVLVPRRAPRAEQLIRAERLASLGLADVIDERSDPAEVIPLLEGPRRTSVEHVLRCGIALDGAAEAAVILGRLAVGARR